MLFLHFEGYPKVHPPPPKKRGNGSVIIFNTLFTNTETKMCKSAVDSLVIKTSTNVADYTLNSKNLNLRGVRSVRLVGISRYIHKF